MKFFPYLFLLLCIPLLSTCVLPREGLAKDDLCIEIRTLDLPQSSVLDGVWESSPMHEGYPEVAPGECVLFPLEPPFSAPPRLVQVYNAFPNLDGGEPDFTTPSLSTGDTALLVEVTANTIILRNLSGVSFLYRIAAQ